MENAQLVQDLMTRDLCTVGRNDPLSEVDVLMRENEVRHVPVLDDNGLPCGIISQRDIFRGAILRALGYGQRAEEMMLNDMVAKEVMSAPLIEVSPDATVAEAARLMLEHKVGAVTVTQKERLVGLITESDLLRVIAQ